MTDDGELCCEDCEYFEESPLWMMPICGECKLDGYSTKATSDICENFEERYD